MAFSSIKQRLLIHNVLFISLLLGIIAVGTFIYFRVTTRELILTQQYAAVNSIVRNLDNDIIRAQKALIAVADATGQNELVNSVTAEQWLQKRIAVHTFFVSGLSIIDSTGVLLATYPRKPEVYGTSVASTGYFKSTMESGKPFIANPTDSPLTKSPTFEMTAPIRNATGTIIGILCGHVDILNSHDLLSSLYDIKFGSNGYVYLFAPDRTMIMHPDRSRIMKQDVLPGVNILFDRALTGFEGSGETVNSKGLPFLASFKRLTSTNWILAANYPKNEAYRPISRFRDYYLLGMVLVLLAALALARSIGLGISKPLTVFTTDILTLTKLDSDMTHRLDISRGDELGTLARSFNILLDKVNSREQELAFSERRFRQMFDQHVAIMLMIEPLSGKIIDANQSAADFYGYPLAQLRTMSINDINLPTADTTLGTLKQSLSDFSDNLSIVAQRLSNGEIRTVEVHSTPIGEENHMLLYSIIHDITDRIQYEQALQDKRQRLADVLEATDTGTWEWNIQSGSVLYNKQAADIIGSTLDELSPGTITSWMENVHPDDLPTVKILIKKHFSGEIPHYKSEMRIRHKNGTWVWIHNRGKITRWSPDGAPLLMQGTHRDITRRKEAEDRLKVLTRAIEQCPVSIVITDTQGKIEYVNPFFTTLTGYTLEEAIGQNPRILKTEQVNPDVFKNLWSTIMSGETWEGNLLNKSKDGRLFWEHSVISALRNDGVITHFLAVKEDITEKFYISEQLLIEKEKAEAATVAKSSFLATMSHEIRTPMNGVIGMTGLLLDTSLNDEQREYAEIVRKSGESLLSLINDILDFSKIEAGKLDLEILDFDLRSTIEDTVDILALRASDKKLDLFCTIDSEVPLQLKGDPGRLRQIIINLAGNSIKFTEQGEVIIRATLKSDEAQFATILFEVQDTGIGIPAHRLSALFTPFTQVDGSTTRKYGGTGLGLAICKQLAELMDGQIGVSSEAGKGSTFWFSARFEKQPDLNQETGDTTRADVTGSRVLVVDDNSTNRKLITALLGNWGCHSAAAANGDSALQLLREAVDRGVPFQIALLDHQMPDMDGLQLGKIIKSDSLLENTSLVMVTSIGQRGEITAFEEIGFSGYLTKPIRQLMLKEAISRARGNGTTTVSEDSRTTELLAQPTITEQNKKLIRILLAEDNVINQKVAQKMLKSLGYRVDMVANGLEAIRALEMINYDLVLMDCMMPEMGGFEATALIRSEGSMVLNHSVPIIAMTANAMSSDREECFEAGMDDYLSKPVKKEEMAAIIDKWVVLTEESSH